LTPDKNPDTHIKEYLGYPIYVNRGFEFPLYNHITLSFDFAMQTRKIIEKERPDIIHVATPSALVWPAVLWSKVYNIPLLASYHTDFAAYARAYTNFKGNVWVANQTLRNFLNRCDLTLCTSPQLKELLESVDIDRVGVWQKGINVEVRGSCIN
jgi:sulfoquinovosyltransferase